jgi:hypothetical protein
MVALRQNTEAVVRTHRKAFASAVGCLLAAVLAMSAGAAGAFSVNGAHGVSISAGPGVRTNVGDSPDPFASDPLARAALDRRCPEILADPTWYDDDIIALCLQARKRRHAAVDGER